MTVTSGGEPLLQDLGVAADYRNEAKYSPLKDLGEEMTEYDPLLQFDVEEGSAKPPHVHDSSLGCGLGASRLDGERV